MYNRAVKPDIISTVPDDIIREIIIVGLCVYQEDYDPPGSRKYKFPSGESSPPLDPRGYLRLVCSICSSWRTLSRNTPELWSHIGIVLQKATSFHKDAIAHFTETCLELSRAHLLDILLWSDLDPQLESQQRFVDLLKTVLPSLREHAHRWRGLDLRTAGNQISVFGELYTYLNMNVRGELPRLKHLRVRGLLEDREEGFLPGLSSCALRTLEMPGYPAALAGPGIASRFPNVSELSIGRGHDMYLQDFLTTLTALNSLTRLTLDGVRFPYIVAEREAEPSVPAKLESLEYLAIANLRVEQAKPLFRCLACPRLHTLALGHPHTGELHVTIIERLSAMQFPALRALIVSSVNEERVPLFYSIPPWISHLTIWAEDPSLALQWMMEAPTGRWAMVAHGVACTGLTSLELYNVTTDHTSIKGLTSFITARGHRQLGGSDSSATPSAPTTRLSELVLHGFKVTPEERDTLVDHLSVVSINGLRYGQ